MATLEWVTIAIKFCECDGKVMVRHLALVSSLAIINIIVLIHEVGATPATEDVNFNGTITGTCTFSGTTAGTPGQKAANTDSIKTDNSTTLSTGNAGSTTVNCTSGGMVSVATSVDLSQPTALTDNSGYAVAYDATDSQYTSAGTALNSERSNAPVPIAIPANTNRTLELGLVLGKNSATRRYQYRITVTATPN